MHRKEHARRVSCMLRRFRTMAASPTAAAPDRILVRGCAMRDRRLLNPCSECEECSGTYYKTDEVRGERPVYAKCDGSKGTIFFEPREGGYWCISDESHLTAHPADGIHELWSCKFVSAAVASGADATAGSWDISEALRERGYVNDGGAGRIIVQEMGEASAVDKLVTEIATAVVDAPSTLLVFSGAGAEPDLDELEPNSVHALCSLVCSRGGAHVTANFSGVQLLGQPHEEALQDSAKFVAVHGTIYDQLEGRGHAARRRRPRCAADSQVPMLHGRSTSVPIPMQDVKDGDPNMRDARDAAAGKATLLVLGSSALKATNGRSLHFLDAADKCRRVVFVNPDRSRSARLVADDLGGWGLPRLRRGHPSPPPVECAHMDANEFARRVLGTAAMTAAGLREQCMRWVDPPKVRLMRQRFSLPAKAELGAVRDHPFGASCVTVGTVFDAVARLHALANGRVVDHEGRSLQTTRQQPPSAHKRTKTGNHELHTGGTSSSSGSSAATGAGPDPAVQVDASCALAMVECEEGS